MGEPIRFKDWRHVERPVEVEKEYTYEELLNLFDDDHNLVRPLVLRCMEYEKEIERLKAQVNDYMGRVYG